MIRVGVGKFFCMLLFCVALSACGGGGDKVVTPPPPPVFFAQGLYEITGFSGSSSTPAFTLFGGLSLADPSTVTGVLHIRTASCFSSAADLPTVGTLTSDTIALVATLPSGQKMSFNLTHPFGHTTFVTGTYALAGPGCAAPDSGQASGRIDGFTATDWKGTFTSSTNVVSQITMTLTQTGPDAHGLFSATGTATITGGTCFGSASIDPATVIVGVGSTLVLDNSTPATSGTTTLTGDFTDNSFFGGGFNGTYTSQQGACSETGTVSMSFL